MAERMSGVDMFTSRVGMEGMGIQTQLHRREESKMVFFSVSLSQMFSSCQYSNHFPVQRSDTTLFKLPPLSAFRSLETTLQSI